MPSLLFSANARREKQIDVAQVCLLLVGSAVILAILLVSYRMRRSHLCKTFTVALFCAYLPAQMLHPVLILIYGVQDYDRPMLLQWPERLYKVFLDFSHSQYEMNSLIFLLLAFAMYTKPSFTTTVISEHNFPFIFFASYGLILLLVTVRTIFDGIFDRYHGHSLAAPSGIKHIRDSLFYALQLLRATPYVLIWVFIALAISKLIWEYKSNRTANDRRLFAKNRKLLISAVCFLVIPQLLHFPTVAAGCIQAYRRAVGGFYSRSAVERSLSEISFYGKQFRILILSLCTIFVLPPYRNAVFGCRVHHVSVVPLETHSHPSFCQCAHCASEVHHRT